jgi:RHS repeat-associated protein
MVALNENFASDRKARIEQAESAQSSQSVDHQTSAYLRRLRGENRFLFIGRNADAYGNTLIYTGPGTGGVRFTDDDSASNYGANDIIYCGYRYDPETELYYVRSRTFNPVLGRWLQRDPIGYRGGINLYEYVGGRAVTAVYPPATQAFPLPPPPPGVCSAGCRDELIICIVVSTADADTTFFACVSSFYACLAIICDDVRPPWPPPGPPPGPQLWTWPPESC